MYSTVSVRVLTEIGKQNSRTFPQLFKHLLHFSRIHFSYTVHVTHLILLICRISFPFGIVNIFPLRANCFCLISALRIVSAYYFCFCLSGFPLCKVSLPVAFYSYYMYLNRIELNRIPLQHYPRIQHCTLFLLPILQFSCFLLCTASKKKTVSIIFKDFL